VLPYAALWLSHDLKFSFLFRAKKLTDTSYADLQQQSGFSLCVSSSKSFKWALRTTCPPPSSDPAGALISEKNPPAGVHCPSLMKCVGSQLNPKAWRRAYKQAHHQQDPVSHLGHVLSWDYVRVRTLRKDSDCIDGLAVSSAT